MRKTGPVFYLAHLKNLHREGSATGSYAESDIYGCEAEPVTVENTERGICPCLTFAAQVLLEFQRCRARSPDAERFMPGNLRQRRAEHAARQSRWGMAL